MSTFCCCCLQLHPFFLAIFLYIAVTPLMHFTEISPGCQVETELLSYIMLLPFSFIIWTHRVRL
ncbi:hypothetical protein DFJ77DRAFT_454914 [Powellomyces hirtus]|nr:hypothetical protein DFJ77DRAFT_454914 [Powellomyces hirtus]